MTNLSDVRDDINEARRHTYACRVKSTYAVLSVLIGLLILFLISRISTLTNSNILTILTLFLFLGLCITSLYFAVTSLSNGILYLRKYRHTKQGTISVIVSMILSLLVIASIACCYSPPPKYRLHAAQRAAEISYASTIGKLLFSYAIDHDGRYPDDLVDFIRTEPIKIPQGDLSHLFYQKGSKKLRWILTPGLKISDDPNTILLQSADKFKEGSQEYLVIYTVGNSAQSIKNPSENITIINGKPTLGKK